jgi:hypothetical protein
MKRSEVKIEIEFSEDARERWERIFDLLEEDKIEIDIKKHERRLDKVASATEK